MKLPRTSTARRRAHTMPMPSNSVFTPRYTDADLCDCLSNSTTTEADDDIEDPRRVPRSSTKQIDSCNRRMSAVSSIRRWRLIVSRHQVLQRHISRFSADRCSQEGRDRVRRWHG